MRLDLGGIAKGYALDQALRVLRARKISRALVSGGGDLVAGEPPPGKRGWRVELPPLDASNAPPTQFVELRNARSLLLATFTNGWKSTANVIRTSSIRTAELG